MITLIVGVNQNDVAPFIEGAVIRLDTVEILTGVQGTVCGTMAADTSLHAADPAKFGDWPRVAVHDDEFKNGYAEVLGLKGADIVVRVPGFAGFNHNIRSGHLNQPTNVLFIKGTTSPSVVPYNPRWKP